MSDNIILISDLEVFAIPIHDNNGQLVELIVQPRIFLSSKKTKVTVVDKDDINTINPNFTKVRQPVYNKLMQPVESL